VRLKRKEKLKREIKSVVEERRGKKKKSVKGKHEAC
jgi:hypothetical protein